MYRPYLRDPPSYKPLFDGFEEIASSMGGRPHWAKAFNMEKFDLGKLFPRTAGKFLEVR